jgi:peptidyl-prolyl cis-trans isomerase C
VHRQLSQKMRFLLEDSTALPAPTDAQLQAWLDQHMARYGKPPSISFQQVFLSRGRRADHMQSDTAKISATLAAKPDQFLGLGDPFPLGQEIRDANSTQLRRDFGAEFAAALQALHSSGWSAPLASGFGLHLVRITKVGDFQPVNYQLAQREQMTQRAIENIRKKYRVEFEALPA